MYLLLHDHVSSATSYLGKGAVVGGCNGAAAGQALYAEALLPADDIAQAPPRLAAGTLKALCLQADFKAL